jgi:prepilin-type N-terminal cleavage/methylation domain-containing protein
MTWTDDWMKKAFSLVELMIVVAIIGILAAMVIPKVSDYSKRARDAAAKENLLTLRSAIELYASQHNGVPPGYANNDVSTAPNAITLALQLTQSSNAGGTIANRGTPGFPYGPYIRQFPINPFNNSGGVMVYGNAQTLPAAAPAGVRYGWVYHPATKSFRLNTAGNDTAGAAYWSY